jgi:hypothetical protein
MPAGLVPDDRGERHQHDVGGVGGVVRQQRDEEGRGREQRARRAAHRAADQRAEQARALRDRGPQHHHHDQAERREAGEGRRHPRQQPPEVGRRQQALGDDRRTGEGVRRAQAGGRRQHGGEHQGRDQPQEDHHRIGQRVAEPLDAIEQAATGASAAAMTSAAAVTSAAGRTLVHRLLPGFRTSHQRSRTRSGRGRRKYRCRS